ncbi:MAG TPA: flagellar basal-body rod protein FlgF [Acidobacteriota bacterium]|nr:flagellar basal-body rod protein FlgF [Acidobacteriota bacterium]
MNSGIYTAVSGLRAQVDALDILSNNLSNLNTAGYKEDKTFFRMLSQEMDSGELDDLNKAIDRQKVAAESTLNPSAGSLTLTHRDLDIALMGNGFLVVQTPQGIRYTRNGNLLLNSKSVLSTSDGFPVLGERGRPIQLGPGHITINESGEVLLDEARTDRLKIVSFEKPSSLLKEGGSLLYASDGRASEKPSEATVNQGYLEQSNVNPVSAVVSMVGILRQFEAIQKSVNLVMNDINSKSIENLAR